MANVLIDIENKIQIKCMEVIKKGDDHVFYTGPAGTGKTTFTYAVIDWLLTTDKRFVILATTGIAATLYRDKYGGEAEVHTVDKFYKLGINGREDGSININDGFTSYAEFDYVIIDEMSMMSALKFDRMMMRHSRAWFDSMEHQTKNLTELLKNGDVHENLGLCMQYSKSKTKFIFIGDAFQLAPVVVNWTNKLGEQTTSDFKRMGYESIFFFDSYTYRNMNVKLFEFKKNYRQNTDLQYAKILNRMRIGKTTEADIEKLNTRVFPGEYGSKDRQTKVIDEISKGAIFLAAKNVTVDAINEVCIAKLDSEKHIFEARIKGNMYQSASATPLLKEMTLCVGMQVMARVNTQDFVNGDMMEITSIEKAMFKGKELDYFEIKAKKKDDTIVKIGRHISVAFGLEDGKIKNAYYEFCKTELNVVKRIQYMWEYCPEVISQYPIVPAFAITIHKCQGLTFKGKVIIENGVFSEGQLYVGVSRLTELNNLWLTKPVEQSQVMVSKAVLKFTHGT